MPGPRQVVLANSADLVKIGQDLAEGYYVVGSGDTGTPPPSPPIPTPTHPRALGDATT